MALHDQRPPRERDLSLRDYVLQRVQGAAGARGRAAAAWSTRWPRATSGDEPLHRRDGALRGRRRLRLARARALDASTASGFVDDDLDRPLATFSGGQLTRASLARALAAEPDLLLLDEPTNHLDIESLEWLEKTLLGLDAAIILVAHDRWFLETVGTAVLELEAGRSRFFKGTLAQLAQGAGGARARARAGDRQAEGRDRAAWRRSSSASARRPPRRARRRTASRSSTRSSASTRDPRDDARLEFQFKKPERSGRVIFELEDARLEVGDRPPRCCCADAELWLERGEHVSLVGPNGTGKTTLIKALAGERPLDGGRAAHRAQRQGRLPQPARRGARGRRRADGRSRPRSSAPG